MKSELVEKAQVVHGPNTARQPMGVKIAAQFGSAWESRPCRNRKSPREYARKISGRK